MVDRFENGGAIGSNDRDGGEDVEPIVRWSVLGAMDPRLESRDRQRVGC